MRIAKKKSTSITYLSGDGDGERIVYLFTKCIIEWRGSRRDIPVGVGGEGRGKVKYSQYEITMGW